MINCCQATVKFAVRSYSQSPKSWTLCTSLVKVRQVDVFEGGRCSGHFGAKEKPEVSLPEDEIHVASSVRQRIHSTRKISQLTKFWGERVRPLALIHSSRTSILTCVVSTTNLRCQILECANNTRPHPFHSTHQLA